MNIELVAYTPEPESVCNLGAEICVSESRPDLKDDGFKALGHALRSGHESVLEHATFTFAIEGISRACSHQLVRHRMASYSQQSQRYVNMDKFSTMVPPTIRDASDDIFNEFYSLMIAITNTYASFIERGIPEEDARYILPNACCTNIIVTMNARELRHFFSLRCCERAQWEIKQVAEMMLALVREVAPTLFDDAGAQCKSLGYCPETKGCGRYPKKVRE